MQLKEFSVQGLFGSLDHRVEFPVPSEENVRPSVVIIHGRNGIGKTTMLHMLDGLMSLDFNIFRTIPFTSCNLDFTTGSSISVKPVFNKELKMLAVSFEKINVRLHPKQPGGLAKKDSNAVKEFREAFFDATDAITFEFIDTERLYQLRPPCEPGEYEEWMVDAPDEPRFVLRQPPNPKARRKRQQGSVTSRVARFVHEAQINYRRFFSTTEPDLFPRIIERLTTKEKRPFTPTDLKARLKKIHTQDQNTERLGLEPDRWDYKQLVTQLTSLARRKGIAGEQALTVVGSYVELLESRAAERALVADRLLTFERLISEFMTDKQIGIDPRGGLNILTKDGKKLEEHQLSSGEFHLLFLMVSALGPVDK